MKIAGSHGGADRYSKLRMSANRVYELAEIVNNFGPDVAITFSSPEASRVAFGLGIRHFAFNDSPHSEAVARLTIPLASRLYCPWIIPLSAWKEYGISKRNIVRYHALDPAAWLKHVEIGERPKGLSGRVLVRLEESKASYVADKGLGTIDFVDRLVEELHGSTRMSLLCRYQDQIDMVEARYGSKVEVLHDVVDGAAVIQSAQLFVGAGGTMTAEAALLGTPTISITPFTFYVEKYLIRTGLVKKVSSPTALVRLVKRMLSDNKFGVLQKKKAARLLRSMEDPTDRIVDVVNSVGL